MGKYLQGVYQVQNPQKYIGKGAPKYRSSWEQVFMRFCDNHPSILQWASESIHVPYRNPLTGKNTIYVPDLFILYIDKNGQKHAELIEIKPSKEAGLAEAKSARDKLMVALNFAKWQAATKFCAAQGIKFRVVTEHDLFQYGVRK